MQEDLSKLKIDKTQISKPQTRKKYFYMIFAAVLVLFALLYFIGIISPAIQVETTNVVLAYPSQSFTILNASGYVVAQRKAAVASKITGRLEWIGVEEGNKVKKGQIIARLEGKDVLALKNQAASNLENMRSMLEDVKATLEFSELDYNRKKQLFSRELISRSELDASELSYKKAKAGVNAAEYSLNASKAALNSAEVAIEYTLIRAPFDAVVLTKNADIGDIITPLGAAANAKAAVVTIADMSSLQVEVDVSESNIEKVKHGQPCEIQLDALSDIRFLGMVHMIVPTADRTKASVMVKVKFLEKDEKVLPEMSAKVAFLERPVNKEERIPRTLINPSTVLERNGKKVVYLIKNDIVIETPVILGTKFGDMVEILEGVKAGDRIVLTPLKKIRNNSKVKTAEK